MFNTAPFERAAKMLELQECERRIEQLRVRVGELDPPTGAEREAVRMAIADEQKPRAEARIDALEKRCQELLEELWPIGDRGGADASTGAV